MIKTFDRSILLKLLLFISRRLPPIWRISGLSNRVIKPIWCFFGDGASYVLPIWAGLNLRVDPCEVVGGNLAFIPQLYDLWEREYIKKTLPPEGVFVDVGSNIGAYSLWASLSLSISKGGRILAIEADPDNFSILKENVLLNKKQSLIECHHGGVADKHEILKFYKNTQGNLGGHSFIGTGENFIEVPCSPLSEILKQYNIERVDFMKLDIEGFEEIVLRQFFADVPINSEIRPDYLLVEIKGGPVDNSDKQEYLKKMICGSGYKIVVDKDNTLFKKIDEK